MTAGYKVNKDLERTVGQVDQCLKLMDQVVGASAASSKQLSDLEVRVMAVEETKADKTDLDDKIRRINKLLNK